MKGLLPAILAVMLLQTVPVGAAGKSSQQTPPAQASATGTAKAREDKARETILLNAVTKIELGDFAGAKALLKSADRRWPLDDAITYYLGLCEMAAGESEDAEKHFRLAEAIDTSNIWYSDMLASFYYEAGRDAEARAIYLKLLEKDPAAYSNAYTLTLLGDRYLSEYKDTLAMENYERALMHTPGYIPAVLGKSEVYRMRGNTPAYFREMILTMGDGSLNPTAKAEYVDQLLHRIDGNFYRLWRVQLDSLVNACVGAHPTDSAVLKMAGAWYYGTERKEEGRALFGRLLEAYPKDLGAHYIRLSLLFEDGNMKDVVDECNAIIAIGGKNNPKVLQAYSALGDCYYTIGSSKKAFQAYDNALRLDPGYLPVLNNYAYYLCLGKKKLKKAAAMSLKTVEKEPDNATYLDTYGWILHLQKKDAQAKPYFKHAMLYGGKESAVILEHYAVVLEALGDRETAKYYRSLAENKKK
ncbi:MAG: tetratricopeptide repeat protein [Bacteroidales bacterium]|nr:tetratricopeptide repeat protein [Bacteroidales bacterium]